MAKAATENNEITVEACSRKNESNHAILPPADEPSTTAAHLLYIPGGYQVICFRQQMRETIAGHLASSLEPPHPRDLLVRLYPGTEEAPDFETTCQCRPRRHPLQPWRTRTSLPPSHLSRPLPAGPLLPLSMAEHGMTQGKNRHGYKNLQILLTMKSAARMTSHGRTQVRRGQHDITATC